jgi:hypothetical protein
MAPPTRRTVVAGTVATATAIAGCSSIPLEGTSGTDDGRPSESGRRPDATSAHTPPSLTIDTVTFCADAPSGYDDYEEQPAKTYRPDDVVWLYLEPSTVGTEPAGDGQVRFALDVTWTVYGPDGDEMKTFTDTAERTVPESTGEQAVFLSLSVVPPERFEPGTHRVEVEVTDTIADNRARTTASFDVERPRTTNPEQGLAIEHLRFLAEEPTGYRAYTTVEDATYETTETVWVYFEPSSPGVEKRDDGLWYYEFDVTVRTTGPDGDEQQQVRETLKGSLEDGQSPDELYLAVNFDMRSPTPGEHVISVTVHDQISGDRATEERTFTIEQADRLLAIAFKTAIRDETDIDVRAVEMRESVLHMSYRTPNAFGSDEFNREIGFVAGAYASIIERGHDAERLRATGTEADGQTFVFEIETATAEAWNADEITEGEYLAEVFESLHRTE